MSIGNDLLGGGQVEIIHVDEELHRRSWQLFRAIRRKNLSFVDCSTLATMGYAGIGQLATFDVTDFGPLRKQFAFRII